jgi:proteasome assembly chaperone (PAC2) family protein
MSTILIDYNLVWRQKIMTDTLELWEIPLAKEITMIAGWRQWADAGAVSSGLPEYLIQRLKAHLIGKIHDDGFYLFQIPGTHDLLRPVIRYEEGYPAYLETPHNEIYYYGDENHGLVIFIGDEPQLNIESYVKAIIECAKRLNVRRVVGLGGVYGEVPYQKERTISSTYSLKSMKPEIEQMNVNLSDYQGGASISSFICRRAGEAGLEFMSFYAFVPTYDFSQLGDTNQALRIENDFTAWLSVMHRVNAMFKLDFDLTELDTKSVQLIEAMDEKIEEIDKENPSLGVKKYLEKMTENFEELPFNPSENFWEEKLKGLFDKLDEDPST